MRGPQKIEDALIVGVGPIGLACAISAKRRNLEALVIDAGAVVNSIVRAISEVFIENGRFDGERIFSSGQAPKPAPAGRVRGGG